MNKKMISLLLVVIMLLCSACGKGKTDPSETTIPVQTEESTASTEGTEPIGTVPGTAQNIFGPDSFEDEPESTGSADTGNSGSNSASNNGTGNTGNTGNQGGSNQSSNTGSSDTGTKPTEPKPTEPKPTQPTPTKPEPTEPKPTQPTPTEPDVTDPPSGIKYVSYETYNNMSPEEQLAYFNQFPSMEDFVKWYNEAKAEYDEDHGAIDIGDGNIDMGDIINP